jgi:hypothetical protein
MAIGINRKHNPETDGPFFGGTGRGSLIPFGPKPRSASAPKNEGGHQVITVESVSDSVQNDNEITYGESGNPD